MVRSGRTPLTSAPGCTHIDDLPDGALHAVFDLLNPRDLVSAAATCKHWSALTADDASDRAWRAFFTARWRPGDAVIVARPPVPPGEVVSTRPAPPWRAAYGRRLAEASALAPPTRPAPDSLAGGHKGAARAVALLPSLGLVGSAGADRVVRLFDLADGLPLATSRRLPFAVRCLAVNATCLAAASGSDERIALWQGGGEGGRDTPGNVPWDLSRRALVLSGHTGPVAGLAVSDAFPRLYSASWDCSVRVWDTASLACLAAAPLRDWVWTAVPRGGRVVCSEGRGAAVLDGGTLSVLARVPPSLSSTNPPGPCARVEGSRDGRSLFVAHADGGVASYDLRSPGTTAHTPARSAIFVHPGTPAFPPASSLAYDDPWLALGLGSAGIVLLDTRSGGGGGGGGGHTMRRFGTSAAAAGQVLGVDLAGPHLAAACSSGTVLTWRWDAVAAAAARARAARGGSGGRQRQHTHQPHPHQVAAVVADCWEDAAVAAA